jgi:hypothetical protein
MRGRAHVNKENGMIWRKDTHKPVKLTTTLIYKIIQLAISSGSSRIRSLATHTKSRAKKEYTTRHQDTMMHH